MHIAARMEKQSFLFGEIRFPEFGMYPYLVGKEMLFQQFLK